MKIMSVGNLLARVHFLLNTIEFILERDLRNVVSMGRPLVRSPTLFSIRKLIVE